MAPELNFENSNVRGILFGLFSALCYSIRILILKKIVKEYHGSMLMFYQTFVITILLVPVLFFLDVSGFQSQVPYLLILAIVTTAVGHSLMVHSLKFFSASTATLISSIQPVFGMFIAFIIVNEIPSLDTIWGGLLILSTVGIEAIRSKKSP